MKEKMIEKNFASYLWNLSNNMVFACNTDCVAGSTKTIALNEHRQWRMMIMDNPTILIYLVLM